MAYLQHRFPATRFHFVNAGIPSMGSTPSAFRLQRDIWPNEPLDLLFVEAAVNDQINHRSPKEQRRAMEGIVRNLRRNSALDIVMLHFADPDKIAAYQQGQEPIVIQNHNAVAEHYQIPTVNLAKEVAQRIKNQEFRWKEDFVDLHPSPFGQKIYARSIIQMLETAYAAPSSAQTSALPARLDNFCYENGRLIDISAIDTPVKGWQMVSAWKPNDGCATRPNYTDVAMLIGQYEPEEGILPFRFCGNAAGIVVAAGLDAGMIEYRIDNAAWQTQNLYTEWSQDCHLPWYYTLVAGLSPAEHELEIRLSPKKDPRSGGNVCRIRYFFANEK